MSASLLNQSLNTPANKVHNEEVLSRLFLIWLMPSHNRKYPCANSVPFFAVHLLCLTSTAGDLFCGLKQPMGPASPWLCLLPTGLAKAVILLNRAGHSASSWNVRLFRMHTQFSTDCSKQVEHRNRKSCVMHRWSSTSCFNNFAICMTGCSDTTVLCGRCSHAFCCRTTLCTLLHRSHSVQWQMLTLWSCYTLWCGIIKLKWESKRHIQSDTKDSLTLYRRIRKANKPYHQVYLPPHSLSHIQPKSRSDPGISSSPVCCFASCCLYFC